MAVGYSKKYELELGSSTFLRPRQILISAQDLCSIYAITNKPFQQIVFTNKFSRKIAGCRSEVRLCIDSKLSSLFHVKICKTRVLTLLLSLNTTICIKITR